MRQANNAFLSSPPSSAQHSVVAISGDTSPHPVAMH